MTEKIVCINDFVYNGQRVLTKGKLYYVKNTDISTTIRVCKDGDPTDTINLFNYKVFKVRVVDDNGQGNWYFVENRFVSLEEYRNTKLESIGI